MIGLVKNVEKNFRFSICCFGGHVLPIPIDADIVRHFLFGANVFFQFDILELKWSELFVRFVDFLNIHISPQVFYLFFDRLESYNQKSSCYLEY